MTQAEYLPDFILAYLACALWSTTDDKGEPLDNEFAVCDIPPELRDAMSVDCRTFVDEHWPDLKDLDPSQCGHNFWLTRNEHGAGFWDRGLGDVGDRLSEAVGHGTKYPPVDLYVGDDGTVRVTNTNKGMTTKFNPENKEVLTYGECLGPAMQITDQADADQYKAAYVAYTQRLLDAEPQPHGMTAEQVANSNIGYYAGYYDTETRIRVERLFRCSHPVFGSVAEHGTPSPEEAFAAGVRSGSLRDNKTTH